MKGDQTSLQQVPQNTTVPSALASQRAAFPTERASLIFETAVTDAMEREAQDSRLLIIHSNPFRIYWDVFIIILCIYNSISIPLTVGFTNVRNRQLRKLEEFDYCVDLLFLTDLVFNFFTTYTNEHGEEVRSLRLIRRNYFRSGNLALDLLAVIPFDNCVEWADAGINSNSLKLVRCLKLVRLMRLRRIITLLKLKKDIKLVLKIGVVLYFLFLFLHISASLFSLINSEESDYTPPSEVGRPADYYDPDKTRYRYFLSFYYVILMLLGADVVVFNTTQSCFAAVVLLVGSMITAVLFGQITVFILNLNSESAAMQEATEATSDVMISLHLPKQLTNHVLEFLSRTHNYRKRQSDLKQFFQMVPEDLKQQVLNSVFALAINKSKLFDSENREKVLKSLQIVHTKPEETIVRRGDRSDTVYIVSTGELLVLTVNDQGTESVSRTLSSGSYFGELGVLLMCRRSATVTAVNYCVLAALDAKVFMKVSSPNLRWKLKEHIYQTYTEPWRNFVVTSLRKVPCLSVLSDLELSMLSYQMRLARLSEGSYIVQAGQAVTSALVVVSGEVSVELNFGPRGKCPTLLLGKGSVCFGSAFLGREVQSHGVLVSQEAVVLQLDVELVTGETYLELKKRLPVLRNAVDSASLSSCDFDFTPAHPRAIELFRIQAIRTGMRQHRLKPVRRGSVFSFSRLSSELLAQKYISLSRKDEEIIEVSESEFGAACLHVFQMSMAISKGVEELQTLVKQHEAELQKYL